MKNLSDNQSAIWHRHASEEIREMLSVNLIKDTIQAGMPSLLNGSEKSSDVLDKIHWYLFEQNNLSKTAVLEPLITEELFHMLYGLKSLLQKYHLHYIELCLEGHKKQFGNWLKDHFTEEE